MVIFNQSDFGYTGTFGNADHSRNINTKNEIHVIMQQLLSTKMVSFRVTGQPTPPRKIYYLKRINSFFSILLFFSFN